jgi:hypothetical protein
VIPGGRFEIAMNNLLSLDFALKWKQTTQAVSIAQKGRKTTKKDNAVFFCSKCNVKAQAHRTARLRCLNCSIDLVEEKLEPEQLFDESTATTEGNESACAKHQLVQQT